MLPTLKSTSDDSLFIVILGYYLLNFFILSEIPWCQNAIRDPVSSADGSRNCSSRGIHVGHSFKKPFLKLKRLSGWSLGSYDFYRPKWSRTVVAGLTKFEFWISLRQNKKNVCLCSASDDNHQVLLGWASLWAFW